MKQNTLFFFSNDCCDESGDDDVCDGVCSVGNASGTIDGDVGVGTDSSLSGNGAEVGSGSADDDGGSGNRRDGGVNDECCGETVEVIVKVTVAKFVVLTVIVSVDDVIVN